MADSKDIENGGGYGNPGAAAQSPLQKRAQATHNAQSQIDYDAEASGEIAVRRGDRSEEE